MDDVHLIVPADLYEWPDGEQAPGLATLCQSLDDPQRFEVFKQSSDIREGDFKRTGWAYGGTLSEPDWKRFAQDLPHVLDFYQIPDTDPPGAMDEVMHSLRAVN